tara:strand:+ start:125 stop:820 length:696 start_codon:yes stop_codon:yes gene_type:complete
LELVYSKELKIRDIAKTNPKEILQTINYLYVLLSVKEDNKLNEIEESVINGLIITSFNNYSLNEIKHAFRLALAGTIDVKLYSKLDAITLSSVMKAYKKYKDNKLKLELNKSKKPIKLTDEEKKAIEDEFIKTCVNEYINEVKSLKEPKISPEVYQVYRYYWKKGKIKLTDKQIQMYKNKAASYWLKEITAKRQKGDRIAINTPIPTSNENMIAGCLALYDNIKTKTPALG